METATTVEADSPMEAPAVKPAAAKSSAVKASTMKSPAIPSCTNRAASKAASALSHLRAGAEATDRTGAVVNSVVIVGAPRVMSLSAPIANVGTEVVVNGSISVSVSAISVEW